jgi:hypothetical protein
MVLHSSSLRLVLGLFSAITALYGLPGCKGDDASDHRAGRANTAARASRVPQRVVGEVAAPETAGYEGDRDSHSLRRFGADAGIIQIEPLKDREPLSTDTIMSRESVGMQFYVEWRQSDLPAPSGAPETAVDALELAREKTKLRMHVEVASTGRMRVVFLGQGFPWEEGTELRARIDKFGYVLVWPDGKTYRNVVPGALRAWFSDRRLDQGPLFKPKIMGLSAGNLLGQITTRHLVITPVAEMELAQANVPGTGLGALLICRLLIELAGAEPDSALCADEQLPLHAHLTNAPGGKLSFVVTALGKKQDLPLSSIQVPPEHAVYQTSGVPFAKSGTIDRNLLTALRHRSVAPATHVNSTAISIPSTGLLAINRSLSLRALMVDGIIVAWLSPGTELSIPELRSGTYSIAWRDFFGSFIESPKNVVLPSRVVLGTPRDNGN